VLRISSRFDMLSVVNGYGVNPIGKNYICLFVEEILMLPQSVGMTSYIPFLQLYRWYFLFD